MSFSNITKLRESRFMKMLDAPIWSKISAASHALMAFLLIGSVYYFDLHPIDDLLRHVVSYAWDYSHVKMFPLTDLPSYNLYPAFDFLAGLFAKALNPDSAVTVISLLCLSFMIGSVFTTVRYWGKKNDASLGDVLLVTTIFLASMTATRAALGRPESWGLAWALLATTMVNGRTLRTAVIFAGGILASMSYWLAPVLFPMVLVADSSWKKRIAMFSILCAFHLAFWYFWSHGDIFHWPEMLSAWTKHRMILVQEVLPIGVLLLNGYAKLMTLTFVFGLISILVYIRKNYDSRKDSSIDILRDSTVIKFFTAVGVFVAYLSTNMIRIVPTAFGAVLQVSVQGVAKLRIPAAISLVLSITVFSFWGSQLYEQRGYYARGPAFPVPAGSRVLTSFGISTFSMINANPGKLEMLPGMEVGSSVRDVALLSAKVGNKAYGPITCQELQAVGVTHVVDHGTFVGGLLPCMSVLAINDGWALLGIGK